MTVELATEDGAVCADYAARDEHFPVDFTGYNVPEHMHDTIERYINHRLHPGSFLEAVVCNDLKRAVDRADLVNQNCLAEYIRWFHNRAPATCWGSRENYEKWMRG